MENKQIIINFYNCSSCVRSFNINNKISKIIDILKINNSYLTFNGKILNNDKTLKYYNIDNNDILFENKRIKGGIFSTIVKALISTGEFVKLILTHLDDFIMLFVKVVEIIPLIFNPKKFIDDVIFAITYGIKSVVGGMISSMDSGTKSNNEDEGPNSGPKICMPPSIFNLIALVLCPPLAIMLNSNEVFEGIFRSIICAILTVWCYYFPGLIFAAIHILC